MALGNITWRFQEPVDFATQLNKIAERKAKVWQEIGKNLGGALQGRHDRQLDEELANMIEDYDKQGQIDANMKNQMGVETNLINEQIQKIDARMQEITSEIENLKQQQNEMHTKAMEYKIASSYEKELGGMA